MVRRAGRVVGVEYLRISGGAERYDWPSGAVGVAAVIGQIPLVCKIPAENYPGGARL